MADITIYGFEPSTYVKTALMIAQEAGAKADLRPLEFKKPSHFRLHPYGKMPALEHGDVTLFETLAIAHYIDEVFGDGCLTPKNPADRARSLQWASVAIDYAYEDLVSQLHDDAPSPEAVAAASEQLKLLDSALGQSTYFAGKGLSVADFLLYPMVEFAVSKLGDAVLTGLPNLKRWRGELRKRPGARKAA